MAVRKLRAVLPGELVVRSLRVDEAAASGSELELLSAMRDRVAVAVADPNCPARDLASLTRRLREITKDIDVVRAREAEAVDGGNAPDAAFDAEAI